MKRRSNKELPTGYDALGFSAYGEELPTETTWYGHIASVLGSIGIETIQIAGGTIGQASGLPDKLVLCGDSFKFVEFKSMDGDVRLNQLLTMRLYNLKSVLYSGRLSCFLYRQPNRLQLALTKDTSLDLLEVDALKSPNEFWLALNNHKAIGQGQYTSDIARLLFKACGYEAKLEEYLVTVDYKTYTKAVGIQAYSADLALVRLTGLTSKELASTGKAFCVQDSTGEVCIESVRD